MHSEMMDLQEGKCFFCCKPMSFVRYRPKKKRGYTVDHLWPLGMGGDASFDTNCVLACNACNNEKGCRAPTSAELAKYKKLTGREAFREHAPYWDDKTLNSKWNPDPKSIAWRNQVLIGLDMISKAAETAIERNMRLWKIEQVQELWNSGSPMARGWRN